MVRAGQDGNRLDYLVRHGNEIWVYSESLGDVAMDRLTREIRDARRAVEEANARDLRRGVKRTYILLAAAIWLVSLALLVYLAHRISRPIQELTTGLGKLAAGDLNARVQARRDDEIGRAIGAFNNMAGRLQESTERLVYLRQLASWQTLARKMAHEVKNSLTPIRLTVEEMLVRYDDARSRLHGAGHADRGGRNRDPGAPHPRVLAIRRGAAGAARRRWTSTGCCRSASRS